MQVLADSTAIVAEVIETIGNSNYVFDDLWQWLSKKWNKDILSCYWIIKFYYISLLFLLFLFVFVYSHFKQRVRILEKNRKEEENIMKSNSIDRKSMFNNAAMVAHRLLNFMAICLLFAVVGVVVIVAVLFSFSVNLNDLHILLISFLYL